jgi:ribose transport system permease protein/putative xylitol transport system permease protein
VGVPSYWQQVVKGAILLAAVLYDELRRHGRDVA